LRENFWKNFSFVFMLLFFNKLKLKNFY
jgi:hypothetical protein